MQATLQPCDHFGNEFLARFVGAWTLTWAIRKPSVFLVTLLADVRFPLRIGNGKIDLLADLLPPDEIERMPRLIEIVRPRKEWFEDFATSSSVGKRRARRCFIYAYARRLLGERASNLDREADNAG
jgi:hypothetical protein